MPTYDNIHNTACQELFQNFSIIETIVSIVKHICAFARADVAKFTDTAAAFFT